MTAAPEDAENDRAAHTRRAEKPLMYDGIDTKKVAIVTTSWDDGHPLDIRLAEMLARYRMSGTFYVPLSYHGFPVMGREEMRALRTMGMEIGSHTLTHPDLTKLTKNRALHELVESKTMLEDIADEAISSFCYPAGKFNSVVRSWVVDAGYKLARTTLAFRTDRNCDPFCMPVSFQFFPHVRLVPIRHALKEGNLIGLLHWCGLWKLENDPIRLLELVLEYCLKNGGVLHMWGHSWEIEKFHLWNVLEDALKVIANIQGVLYLTNAQLLESPSAMGEPFAFRRLDHGHVPVSEE
jgi:peptidoglycan/xylan/chitin deacetylase (PgdA/CDA1 family)